MSPREAATAAISGREKGEVVAKIFLSDAQNGGWRWSGRRGWGSHGQGRSHHPPVEAEAFDLIKDRRRGFW